MARPRMATEGSDGSPFIMDANGSVCVWLGWGGTGVGQGSKMALRRIQSTGSHMEPSCRRKWEQDNTMLARNTVLKAKKHL